MNTQTYSFQFLSSRICSFFFGCFLALTATGCGLIDLDELLDGECSSLNPECEEPVNPIEPTEPWICEEGDYYYDDDEECYCEGGEWYCDYIYIYPEDEDFEDYPPIYDSHEDEEYAIDQPVFDDEVEGEEGEEGEWRNSL